MLTRMRLLALVLAAWPWGALADTPPARVTNSLTYDAASNAITSTVDGAKRGLDCHVSNALGTPGNVGVVVGGAVIDPRATRALTTSDQVSCAQLGTWSIAGTVSLPTNAAQETGGNLASAAASLTTLNGKVTGFDLDSGAGTQTVQGVNLRLSASGGSVEAGTGSNPLRTDPTGTTTQPVSAASLPLPSGAATAAAQATGNASLSSLDGKVNNTTGGAIKTDGSAFTQPVSAASLPLPAGASTSALQTSGNSSLSSIDGKLPAQVSGRIPVDGSGVTQPVSAASLPLPVGAATSASQTTGNASLASIDGKLGSLGQQAMTGSAPVVIASNQSAIPISGTVTATSASVGATGSAVPAQADFVAGKDGSGNLRGLAVSTAGVLSVDGSASTQPVSVASLPLPSGAATSALQTTGNSSLSSIDGKTATLVSGRVPVDGSGVTQPVSASSLPLPSGAATSAKQPALGTAGTASSDVITVQGIASMTALKVDGSAVTQPVSAASLPLPSGASTSALQTTGNASLSSIDTKTATLVSGRVPTDGSAVTQPISAASLPLPSGATTEATLTKLPIAQGAALGANSGPLSQGSVTTAAPTYTTGNINPLSLTTAGALRTDASAVTQPVSAASLPLPAGAATSALQTTGNASLSSIDGKTATLVSGRVPVDGSAVTQPVSAASLPLPSGAATETSLAKLTLAQGSTTSGQSGTLNLGAVTTAAPSYTTAQSNSLSLTTAGGLRSDMASVGGTALALGQGTMAASLPVAIASNQSNLPVNITQVAGASPSATNPVPARQTDGTNFAGTYANVTGSQGTSSSPGQMPAAFALGVGWDGATHREQAVDTSGNAKTVGNVASGATDSGAPVKVGGIYNATAPTLTDGQRGDMQLDAAGNLKINRVDNNTTTYEAAFTGLATAATATDVFTITGSASKTVKVRKLHFACNQSTGAYQNVVILKRSTSNSGGTSTTLTNTSLDSNNAAATATVLTYTANPTTGTLVGNLRAERVAMSTSTLQVGGGANAAGTNQGTILWTFGDQGQPVTLRGTSQVVAVNLNSTTITGSTCNGWINWTEE